MPCVRARRSCGGACRPLSLTLGLPGASIRVCLRAAFRFVFAVIYMGLTRFLVFWLASSSFFVVIYMGFKALPFFLFDSTVLGEHDLQKHLVK